MHLAHIHASEEVGASCASSPSTKTIAAMRIWYQALPLAERPVVWSRRTTGCAIKFVIGNFAMQDMAAFRTEIH